MLFDQRRIEGDYHARIVETLPVKTRLPLEVWALAGFVTLFSLVTSVAHLSSLSDGASPVIDHAHPARNSAQPDTSLSDHLDRAAARRVPLHPRTSSEKVQS